MLEKLNIKKVDKQEKQIPNSIEQLIQYYDLEKIWFYIENIIENIQSIEIAEDKKIAFNIEYETGRIIDEKKEYGKVINIGPLPNTDLKTIAHGLTNVTYTKIEGVAISKGIYLPLPYVGMEGDITSSISLDVVNQNIRVYAGIDRSTLSGIVTLYYTKN